MSRYASMAFAWSLSRDIDSLSLGDRWPGTDSAGPVSIPQLRKTPDFGVSSPWILRLPRRYHAKIARLLREELRRDRVLNPRVRRVGGQSRAVGICDEHKSLPPWLMTFGLPADSESTA